MGAFRVTIEIGDPQGAALRSIRGSSGHRVYLSVAPASLLRGLGVEPLGKASFELADGRQQEMEIGRTWVWMDGRPGVTLVVFGGEDADPLLGTYTLAGLLLAPDSVRRRLVPVPGLLM